MCALRNYSLEARLANGDVACICEFVLVSVLIVAGSACASVDRFVKSVQCWMGLCMHSLFCWSQRLLDTHTHALVDCVSPFVLVVAMTPCSILAAPTQLRVYRYAQLGCALLT